MGINSNKEPSEVKFNANFQGLIQSFGNNGKVQSLLSSLSSSKANNFLVEGSKGSHDSLLISHLFANIEHSHVIIAQDKEEAAYYQNTLDQLVESQTVLFFPDSFKRPGFFEFVDNTNVLIRTEAINKITNQIRGKEILVTYPEAIFEKVIDPIHLEDQKILIKKGESLDFDTIIDILVEFGFKRVDFVYEPGQFSIRGGIIDIFSFGNEWPYRIELFDEEVENIRTFDPANQLSIRNISIVSIIPDVNNQFSEEHKVSIFDILKEETIIWIKDLDMLTEKLLVCLESADTFSKELTPESEEDLKKILKERAFVFPDDIISSIDDKTIVFLKNNTKLKSFKKTFSFEIAPQPTFNKNFSLLIDDWREKEEQGYTNYLFTDNTKQIERFNNIFEDLEANLIFHPIKKAINAGFIDHEIKVCCYSDHQIFERFHRFKLKKGFSSDQAMNLKMLRELTPGDFVTHMDHGVGRYSGLEKLDINGNIQESVRLIYLNNDILYVGINSLHKISKFVGKEGTPPRLHKIGGDAWNNIKRKTKRKVKDIAKDLIKLYAKRKASKGFAFPEDGYLQNELEASFIYEDTPDQEKSTEAVKEDMQKAYPMDRLICGDVGFGKTEIAIRAAFKSVVAGKQVAILVPTTILALQHFKTFSERMKDFGINVDYLNRFRTTKEKKVIFEKLKAGEIEIIIGTHGLLNKEIGFKDLGLLIIDEEQKFGVAAKEKLRNIKVNVDTLTLTATPIPRTLQFSLMAARDLSLIKTPPPNRQAIHTERRVFSDVLIKDAIYYEIYRGGQVFFVHNRVKTLPDIAAMVKRLCPDANIAMAHGQMEPKHLEKTLLNFIEGNYDVLVSTNIIETGLDIPNANTIIINNAHQFGMSDLHQLRGRVGRSNKKAFCYLFAPPLSTMTSDARKRIQTLEEFSDLGSGFHIAMKDLDIRGAGNLLGGEQSGFISDIGYETYQKILEEAVQELKQTDFKELFKEDMEKDHQYVKDVDIDGDVDMLIPDNYISNIQERLKLYTQLNTIENEEELMVFSTAMEDRFGTIPTEVQELFNGIRLRWISKTLGFEKVTLKSFTLRCFFISNAQSSFFESPLFQNLIKLVSDESKGFNLRLKQSRKYLILIKEEVTTLKEARIILERILDEVS